MKLKALLMSVPVWLSICHPDHNQDRLIQHPSGNDSGVTIADTVSPKQQADPGKQKEYTVTNLNNSEQLVFANGKVIDVWEYPGLLKKIPTASIQYEGEFKLYGQIDFSKIPLDVTQDLLKTMYKDPNVKFNHILLGLYRIGTERLSANAKRMFSISIDLYGYINNRREIYKVGGIAELYIFDKNGNVSRIVDFRKYGLDVLNLSKDEKYAWVGHSGEEMDSESNDDSKYNPPSVCIYETKDWNLLLETTNIPGSVNCYNNNTNCFMTSNDEFDYVIKPGIRKIYKKNISESNYKEWTDDGLYLTDGTVYLYDRDWQVETFDEYNKSNASQ